GRYHTRHYTLNARGETVGISAPGNPGQHRQTLTHNARGQVLSATDALGGQIDYTYDAAGQLIEVTDSEGGVTEFAHDALGRKIFQHEPTGLETTWDYQQTRHYLEIRRTRTDPSLPIGRLDRQRTDIERYDLMGRLIMSEDPSGQRWQYDYNELGLLVAIHNPDGTRLENDYNRAGHLIEERLISTTGEVRRTQYERDAAGRVTYRRAPHGAESHYQYNGLGQITEIRLPDGFHTLRHEYDATGRRTATHHPERLSEYWRYDAAGNITEYTDRNGDTWAYGYNADNQVIEAHDPVSVQQGQAHPTRYHYDAQGQRIGYTDPNGHRHDVERDSLGRVIAQTDAEGH
ncbi:RHS repeat protein, partial [Natronospirillum operosum]